MQHRLHLRPPQEAGDSRHCFGPLVGLSIVNRRLTRLMNESAAPPGSCHMTGHYNRLVLLLQRWKLEAARFLLHRNGESHHVTSLHYLFQEKVVEDARSRLLLVHVSHQRPKGSRKRDLRSLNPVFSTCDWSHLTLWILLFEVGRSLHRCCPATCPAPPLLLLAEVNRCR